MDTINRTTLYWTMYVASKGRTQQDVLSSCTGGEGNIERPILHGIIISLIAAYSAKCRQIPYLKHGISMGNHMKLQAIVPLI